MVLDSVCILLKSAGLLNIFSFAIKYYEEGQSNKIDQMEALLADWRERQAATVSLAPHLSPRVALRRPGLQSTRSVTVPFGRAPSTMIGMTQGPHKELLKEC